MWLSVNEKNWNIHEKCIFYLKNWITEKIQLLNITLFSYMGLNKKSLCFEKYVSLSSD